MESLKTTRFYSIVVLLISLLLILLPSNLAQYEEIPMIKTMEDFSGYPIHKHGQFSSITLASSLFVDAQGLQKQIDELSKFSDAPSPSITRVLYTDKDVLARRNGSEPNLPAAATDLIEERSEPRCLG